MLISAIQQSNSVIHIYTFFFIFFSIMVYHGILNRIPCALQKVLVYNERFYILKKLKFATLNSKIKKNAMRQTKMASLYGKIEFEILFFLSFFWGGAPTVYGGSQARGRIGAVPLAYTTATATKDLSRICDLHRSSQ